MGGIDDGSNGLGAATYPKHFMFGTHGRISHGSAIKIGQSPTNIKKEGEREREGAIK